MLHGNSYQTLQKVNCMLSPVQMYSSECRHWLSGYRAGALQQTLNEEILEVLYSIGGTSSRKFQSVVLTCGERMAVEWATGSSANE